MAGVYFILALSAVVGLVNAKKDSEPPSSSLCPSANGRTIKYDDGNSYLVTCSADNDIGSYDNKKASSSYLDCMEACDKAASDGCQGFTYVGGNGGSGSGTCWLKKRMSTYPSAPANYISAVRVAGGSSSLSSSRTTSSITSFSTIRASSSVSPSLPSSSTSGPSASLCPSYNFTSYADSQDNNWQILCGFDTSPASFGSTNVASFALCLDACTATADCVAVSYVGTACYFKKGYSSLTASRNVNSAYRINTRNYPVPAQNDVYASRGCGSSLPAGVLVGGSSTTLVIASGGQNRSFNIHVPSSYDVNKASPLILAFHGRSATPINIENDSGLSSETTNPYGIVAYPLGYAEGGTGSPQWQGDPATVGANPYIDDQTFTQDLLIYLTSSFCIDTSRILATGFSNGGGFAGVLACNSSLSRQFSSFAINSGAMYTSDKGACNGNVPSTILTNSIVQAQCAPGRQNVPILEFHGESDGTISYSGGNRRGYCLPTIPHWVTDWSVRNGHSTANVSTPLANGQVTKYEFGAGDGLQGIVTHYKIAGWGHNWASLRAGAPIDATPIILDFLYRYTNPNALRYIPAPPNAPSSSSTSLSSTALRSSAVSSIASRSLTTSSTALRTSSLVSGISSSVSRSVTSVVSSVPTNTTSVSNASSTLTSAVSYATANATASLNVSSTTVPAITTALLNASSLIVPAISSSPLNTSSLAVIPTSSVLNLFTTASLTIPPSSIATSAPFSNVTVIANATTITTPISLTTSTTLAVPTPSPITPSCPASNNTLYTEPSTNATFIIECDDGSASAELVAKTLMTVTGASFDQCISFCAVVAGCGGVSLNEEECVLRGVGRASGVFGARLVSGFRK